MPERATRPPERRLCIVVEAVGEPPDEGFKQVTGALVRELARRELCLLVASPHRWPSDRARNGLQPRRIPAAAGPLLRLLALHRVFVQFKRS